MNDPRNSYTTQLEKLTTELVQLTKRSSLFGWLRLLLVLLIIGSAWVAWTQGLPVLLLSTLILLGIFFLLLTKDLNNSASIKNCKRLIAINETELKVLDYNFVHLADGAAFKPSVHEYANDLDIFGRASLFQYINRAQSEQGNSLLASWLLDPADVTTIYQRQEAVKELTGDFSWRQQFQSAGKENRITLNMQEKLSRWISEPVLFLTKKGWNFLRYLLPAASFAILGFHIAGIMAAPVFYGLIFLQLILSLLISRKVMPAYLHLNKVAPELDSLSGTMGWVEKRKFNSKLLNKLREQHSADALPSKKIKKLKKILDLLDIRLNPLVFLPLNAFLFWDLQQVLALEKWKTTNQLSITHWFDDMAEMEALCSFAALSFNNPAWVFPVITAEKGVVDGDKVGHPLVPSDKMVFNSFSTHGLNQMNLITGSNMAGKSTFLRSIGVNIVLAMAGSPVCAGRFTVSHMKVISSMRVSDNLEESTSTFYAELKKLKAIIEAVYAGREVFLLLDEILRGTNSADRHTGSSALIKQLAQHQGAGMIATHDLELARLADEFPDRIHNYHFDVQVANDELYFDYKLKRGVCRSMNASILMKKIGIELY